MRAKHRLDEPAAWLEAQLRRIPGRSDLAVAIRYARSRWPALTAYIDRGQLEISNNAAENAFRPVARRLLQMGSKRRNNRPPAHIMRTAGS